MTIDLISQDIKGPWLRDEGIKGDHKLLRVLKTPYQIIRLADGSIGVSDQAFTSMDGDCSTEHQTLIDDAPLSLQDRVTANNGYGGVEVAVSDVRDTFNRKEGTKGIEPLDVAYTPIPAEELDGPNPFHCDIFPKLGNPGRKLLWSKQRTAVPIDVEKAEAVLAKRHGIVR